MIIKTLKIAIAVGIFSILLTFFSVYRFVSNDKVMSFFENLTGKYSKSSTEALESNKKKPKSELIEDKVKNKKQKSQKPENKKSEDNKLEDTKDKSKT